MLDQAAILNALKAVKYPGYSRDIVSFGLVRQVTANQGAVSIGIELTSANQEAAAQIKKSCEDVLRALPEVKHLHVEVKLPAGAAPGTAAAAATGTGAFSQQGKVPGLARIVAVASGKGG